MLPRLDRRVLASHPCSMGGATGTGDEVVEETVPVAGRAFRLLRPRDVDALVDRLVAEDDPDEARLPFWAELWPSGTVLAEALAGSPAPGARVLDLGCGLGLVSVVAAATGASVLAVDRAPEATAFTAVNAARNGVALETVVCAFEDSGPLLAGAPWDRVVAADVLYEAHTVAVLLRLLPRLVGAGGEAWIADPGRRQTEAFLSGVDRRGWRRDSVATADRVTVHRLRRR